MAAERTGAQQALRAVASARRITVLAGAGVSTDSGIPDFRGPHGVWAKDGFQLDHPVWAAEPNAAHRALVDLERSGRLRSLLTQNIDGLHQRAGSDPALVVELHGTLLDTVCRDCGARGEMSAALDRVRAGEVEPACQVCGGVLKAGTVSFGDALDPLVLRSARTAAIDCDLMLVLGTSLLVEPAAGLVGLAAKAGAAVVICNAEPTPYDAVATAVVRAPIGEVLPALVAEPPVAPAKPITTWGDPSTW